MSPETKVSAPFQYLALVLVSGSILAYELFVMRVFACSGWSHFGSLVISIVMLGFGIFSTLFCIRKDFFQARISLWIQIALYLFGPAMMISNSLAQQVRFNPIFLVSDPNQKYFLASYFLIYLLPFFLGAMFLGLVFFIKRDQFGKAYFANMAGSAAGGAAIFLAMYHLSTERLLIIPILLWLSGTFFWFQGTGRGWKPYAIAMLSAVVSISGALWLDQVQISEFKAVSYARQFPDSRRVSHRNSPFGLLEIYSSSYFHFAPGLSDNAMMYLDEMPRDAFLGMYIDGDGPMGIMKKMTGKEVEYFKFLPMNMPFLLKSDPEVLVIQLGGGISTRLALSAGARGVTVAEGNPLIFETFQQDPIVSEFTGRILDDPKVRLVENDGRIYVRQAKERFDVIDISLADSTGLSSAGGSSIQEKFTYTSETFRDCIGALSDDGILSVTVWNKEDPPKSTLKLAATMADAASNFGPMGDRFFAAQNYLSTFTVLYKRDGFSAAQIRVLLDYCKRMSFEPVFYPGIESNIQEGSLDRYKANFFDLEPSETSQEDTNDLSMGDLYRYILARVFNGEYRSVQGRYIFNFEPLTNDRPYFTGYTGSWNFSRVIEKLDLLTDEWGYLLAWATLLLSTLFGFLLLMIPILFGRRIKFLKEPGQIGVILYFICLGIGYIAVEIVYISKCIICLGNPSVSFAVLVTGMVLFSGIGSYFSEKLFHLSGWLLPSACALIAGILALYAFELDRILWFAGTWTFLGKISFCLFLLLPLAFLLGFPFAMGMMVLAKSGREDFFVWAWGINGSFSVVGSVMVPVFAVNSGFLELLLLGAILYLLAIPSFLWFRSRKPIRLKWSMAIAAVFLLSILAWPWPANAEDGREDAPQTYKKEMKSENGVEPAGENFKGAIRSTPGFTFTAKMENAPFPYEGLNGDTNVNFFDHVDAETGKRFHTNRYGDRFFEQDHYTDNSVLFHIPPTFDPEKPFFLLVFFHGLNTDIQTEEEKCRTLEQVDDSGRNVILIMPQLAKNAVDSSPGKFFLSNKFRNFMIESADILSEKLGKQYLAKLRASPIVLSAFSGGYKAAAYILDRGGENARIRGIFLMDALYEDVDKFGQWIIDGSQSRFFLLLFTRGSCGKNASILASALAEKGIDPIWTWPDSVRPGNVYLVESQTDHLRLPVLGPPKLPLAKFLSITSDLAH